MNYATNTYSAQMSRWKHLLRRTKQRRREAVIDEAVRKHPFITYLVSRRGEHVIQDRDVKFVRAEFLRLMETG